MNESCPNITHHNIDCPTQKRVRTAYVICGLQPTCNVLQCLSGHRFRSAHTLVRMDYHSRTWFWVCKISRIPDDTHSLPLWRITGNMHVIRSVLKWGALSHHPAMDVDIVQSFWFIRMASVRLRPFASVCAFSVFGPDQPQPSAPAACFVLH